MFLIASSSNANANEGPYNNSEFSELDVSTHARSIDPEKIRGEIINHLLTRPVIIPNVAMDELNSAKTTKKLGTKNIQNRAMLNDVIYGKEKIHIPYFHDIQQQVFAVNYVKTQAETTAKKIKAAGGQVPDHWNEKREDLEKHESEIEIDPELENNSYCQLYRKFKPDIDNGKMLEALAAVAGRTETEQRELLEEA